MFVPQWNRMSCVLQVGVFQRPKPSPGVVTLGLHSFHGFSKSHQTILLVTHWKFFETAYGSCHNVVVTACHKTHRQGARLVAIGRRESSSPRMQLCWKLCRPTSVKRPNRTCDVQSCAGWTLPPLPFGPMDPTLTHLHLAPQQRCRQDHARI